MIPPADQRDKPVTLEDLYGKSADTSKATPPKIGGEITVNSHNEPLVYEETPVIEPIVEDSPPVNDASGSLTSAPEMPNIPKSYTPRKKSGVKGVLINILVLLIIFSVGVGATVVYRYYQGLEIQKNAPQAPVSIRTIQPTDSPVSTESAVIAPEASVSAKPTLALRITATPASSPSPTVTPAVIKNISVSGWIKTEAGTKAGFPVPEMTLEIPGDFKAMACDPPGCTSEGTEMTGGTRFTVAVRKLYSPIKNFDKSQISDAGGKVFANTSVASIDGKTAILFNGEFNGTTTGGYTFTKMKGAIIQVTPTLLLEINHFTPTGKQVDFTADDAIFDKILQTVKIWQ
jgi:hypothetical protein